MAVDFRPARPEEMREFMYNSHVGFGNSTADEVLDHRMSEPSWVTPEQTMCAFDDGVLAAKMATFDFQMYWNGPLIGCGGVTAVTTLPTHRRRGYLRELMTRAFAQMREHDQPVAMLWASMAAIYQRFGYGIAYTQCRPEFDPRGLRFVDEIPVPGRTRLVKWNEAAPVVLPCYERFAALRPLMLQNSAAWLQRQLRPWRPDQAPPLVAVYEEAGEVLGWMPFRVDPDRREMTGPNLRVEAMDLNWLSPPAHRALVQLLIGYDLAYQVQLHCLPIDDPLFHQVQEPRSLHMTALDGTLVRIVDLPRALAGRGYDADGRLVIKFSDDLCPWNCGSWELIVDGGRASVRGATTEPELSLTPRALAMLASGHLSATTLAHIGLISCTDARTLRTADALFATAYAPLCSAGF